MMANDWWQNVQTASSLQRHEPLLDIKQERFMQGVSKVSGKVNVDNSITPTFLHGCSPQKSNKVLIQGIELENREANMTQPPL